MSRPNTFCQHSPNMLANQTSQFLHTNSPTDPFQNATQTYGRFELHSYGGEKGFMPLTVAASPGPKTALTADPSRLQRVGRQSGSFLISRKCTCLQTKTNPQPLLSNRPGSR
eukprot:sb/3477109/